MTIRRSEMEKTSSESDLEIELYSTVKERQAYDDQANLYAIIMATEHLERAFARDNLPQEEYTTECNKLLSQFRLAEKAALGKTMTIETFMKVYSMDCPQASERLVTMGVPESIKGSSGSVVKNVAATVQFFITTMDAVKLDQRAVDELQPLLSDLMNALTRLPGTPSDFEPSRKVQQWLQKMNAMRAVDQIDDNDARQLYHDLESAYTEFNRYLEQND